MSHLVSQTGRRFQELKRGRYERNSLLDWKFQELQSENQSSQGNAQHRKEMLLLHKKLGRFAWMAWQISRLGRAALLLLRTHQRERYRWR